MKLFFALDLPASLKVQIDNWRDATYKVLGAGVPAENFHITLAFLGECQAAKLESLTSAAAGIQAQAFDVQLDELGFWHKSGIFWLGSSAAPEGIFELARKCRATAGSQQLFPKNNGANKSYTPHLSLWRNQTSVPPAPLVLPNFQWRCESFSLFESVALQRVSKLGAGVRYRALASWPLQQHRRVSAARNGQ